MHTSAKACDNKQMETSGLYFILYPDSDPDHSQNLMGPKMDHGPSSYLTLFICKNLFVVFLRRVQQPGSYCDG